MKLFFFPDTLLDRLIRLEAQELHYLAFRVTEIYQAIACLKVDDAVYD